jgi:hypothetical protein
MRVGGQRFTSGKETRCPMYRGWVGTEACLDGCRKLSRFKSSPNKEDRAVCIALRTNQIHTNDKCISSWVLQQYSDCSLDFKWFFVYCNVIKAHHYCFITVKVAFILLLIRYNLQITPFLKALI